MLLVRAGMLKDAYQQLREVYDEPVAHYDLGYLLNKRGMKAAALQEFTVALQMSPRMALAREWVERLSRERGDYGPAAVGMSGPPAPPVAPGPVPMNQPLAAPPLPAAPMPPPYATPQQQYTGLPAQVPASNPCAPGPPQPQPPAQPQYVQQATPPPMQYPPAQPQYVQQATPPPMQYPPRGMPAPPQNPPPALPQFAIQPAPQQRPYVAGGGQMPPQIPPQIAGPQYAPPPDAPRAAPADNSLPLVACRDPHATGVPLAPAADGAILSRLPPVNDPQNSAEAYPQDYRGETVAPDPPAYRR